MRHAGPNTADRPAGPAPGDGRLMRFVRRTRRGVLRHADRLRLCGLALVVATLALAYGNGAVGGAVAVAEAQLYARGFGLEQVNVQGHRHTPDGDIFEALGSASAKTLFSFDADAAKVRIEALPWVERATLRRVFPNAIDVSVVERKPAILWHADDGTRLLDRDGRHLGRLPKGDTGQGYGANLIVLEGAGADAHATAALTLLAAFPGIAHRLKSLEFVAGRRWTVHLVDGAKLHLPADDPARALAQALELDRKGLLEKATEIDLRVRDRLILIGTEPQPTPKPPHSIPPPVPKPPAG
ncbi:MAG: hypothetical protein RL291_904 [Pseudomonadota bacterium]